VGNWNNEYRFVLFLSLFFGEKLFDFYYLKVMLQQQLHLHLTSQLKYLLFGVI
jgi:hypothetical protein